MTTNNSLVNECNDMVDNKIEPVYAEKMGITVENSYFAYTDIITQSYYPIAKIIANYSIAPKDFYHPSLLENIVCLFRIKRKNSLK